MRRRRLEKRTPVPIEPIGLTLGPTRRTRLERRRCARRPARGTDGRVGSGWLKCGPLFARFSCRSWVIWAAASQRLEPGTPAPGNPNR